MKYFLFPISLLFIVISNIRKFFYKAQIFHSITFDIPVIGIGNIKVGGTGKSPHTLFIANLLLKNNYYPGIISRGYGRYSSGFRLATCTSTYRDIGDEPMMYFLKNPNIPIAVCENRAIGIPHLLDTNEQINTVIMDDSFQHLAVKPSYNILLTEMNDLYTDDWWLPIGGLRDDKNVAAKANCIIITKCTNLTSVKKNEIINKILPLPHQRVFFSQIVYGSLFEAVTKQSFQLSLCNTSVLLVTGIAQPLPLQEYISNKVKHCVSLHFNDHHNYNFTDLAKIKLLFDGIDDTNKCIITTEKDAARLHYFSQWFVDNNLKYYVQPIEIELLDNAIEFESEIVTFLNNFPTFVS